MALDFLRNFVDRRHHAKEEKHLFVKLEQRGIAREGGPIGVMLAEHEQGRKCVRAAAAALRKAAQGDLAAAGTVAHDLVDYVLLLRSHIDKENKSSTPWATRS